MHDKKLDLIIVGAQKAGTTSLNNYLREHPDVAGHAITEFSFFTDPDEYKMGFEEARKKYFDQKECTALIAKNVTIAFDKTSLPRLKAHNSNVKIVFIMREPVSRAYSAYTMAVKDGWMHRSFSELVQIVQQKQYDDIMYRHFIKHGFYAEQIQSILQYFPANQLRLISFEDFKQFPQQTCNKLFEWLELPNYSINKAVHNPTFQPRSKTMGSILNKLRSNDNPIKRILKFLLPYTLFRALSSRVLKLNKSQKKFDTVDVEVAKSLSGHFEASNLQLQKLIQQLPEGCMLRFDQANWLDRT